MGWLRWPGRISTITRSEWDDVLPHFPASRPPPEFEEFPPGLVFVVTIVNPIPGDEIAVGMAVGPHVVKRILSSKIVQGAKGKCYRVVRVLVEKITKSKKPPKTTAPNPTDGRRVWTATDDGRILPPNTDIDAVPSAVPNPRDPQWIQVHGSHPHRGDPRPHAHGPEPGTGRRIDVPLDDAMRRADDGLRSGELRLRRDRSDRGGP